MNAKTCKQLRSIAKMQPNAKPTTTYSIEQHKPRLSNGVVVHPLTHRVAPGCVRSIYHTLKKAQRAVSA